MENSAKEYISVFLAALGISLAPYMWISGMLFAFAGAAYAMRIETDIDRRKLGWVLFGAFFCAYATGIIIQEWHINFPAPLAMGIAGFVSRPIIQTIMKFGKSVESRSDALSDKILDHIVTVSEEKVVTTTTTTTPAAATAMAVEITSTTAVSEVPK